jgi:hypothetical protein
VPVTHLFPPPPPFGAFIGPQGGSGGFGSVFETAVSFGLELDVERRRFPRASHALVDFDNVLVFDLGVTMVAIVCFW